MMVGVNTSCWQARSSEQLGVRIARTSREWRCHDQQNDEESASRSIDPRHEIGVQSLIPADPGTAVSGISEPMRLDDSDAAYNAPAKRDGAT